MEEVEAEQRTAQSTGGLVDTGMAPTSHGRRGGNDRRGKPTVGQTPTFLGHGTRRADNRSVNTGLFLEGLSTSETMRKERKHDDCWFWNDFFLVFRQRKREMMKSLSHALL